MNRRNFLSLLTAGVAGIALDQAIPLGRVWSFPKKIVVPGHLPNFIHVTDSGLFAIGDVVSIPAFSAQRFIVTLVHATDGTIELADHRGRKSGIVAPSAVKALQLHHCGLPPG